MDYNQSLTCNPEITMKTCPECNKDISDTHPNKKYCSSSCSDKQRYRREGQRGSPEQRSKWYRERCKSDEYKELLRTQGKNRSKAVKEYINKYKLKLGCTDCGYSKHPAALDFDHLPEFKKELNVCNSKSIKQAKEEIKKCEVVCSNCHRIRTYNRLYPCKPDIFKQTYDAC